MPSSSTEPRASGSVRHRSSAAHEERVRDRRWGCPWLGRVAAPPPRRLFPAPGRRPPVSFMPAMPRRRSAFVSLGRAGRRGGRRRGESLGRAWRSPPVVVILDRRHVAEQHVGHRVGRNPGLVPAGPRRRAIRGTSRLPREERVPRRGVEARPHAAPGRDHRRSGSARSAHEPTSKALPEFASLASATTMRIARLAVVGTLADRAHAHRRPEVVESRISARGRHSSSSGPKSSVSGLFGELGVVLGVPAPPHVGIVAGRRGARARTGAASRAGGSGSCRRQPRRW